MHRTPGNPTDYPPTFPSAHLRKSAYLPTCVPIVVSIYRLSPILSSIIYLSSICRLSSTVYFLSAPLSIYLSRRSLTFSLELECTESASVWLTAWEALYKYLYAIQYTIQYLPTYCTYLSNCTHTYLSTCRNTHTYLPAQ